MIAIAIHGGAGEVPDGPLPREGLSIALDAGYAVLESGGSSVDAVNTAVRILEDNSLFNAGKGAVLANDGCAELEASIMDGSTLKAGAVCMLRHIKNPIDLARCIMEKSKHVFLAGVGAEEFAKTQGLQFVPNEYFITPFRQQQLTAALQGKSKDLEGLGTVGAVAIDMQGNLAAASSTGGMTNKLIGRIGDTPIIGSGIYANNNSCAVAATGNGEYFIRTVAAHTIAALVEHGQYTLDQAVKTIVRGALTKLGGPDAFGGIIAIDKQGNIVIKYNSVSMYRALRDSNGRREVAVFEN